MTSSSARSISFMVGLVLLVTVSSVQALEMNFRGDGTRVTGDDDGIRQTEIESPADKRTSDRDMPENPWLDRFNADVTGSVYHHDVDGNRNRSFKDPGTHVLGDVALEGGRDLGSGHVFEIQSNLRGTDDPQVSPDKRWALRSMYGEFRRDGDYRLRLGNVSASFSDYSLSSSADLGLYYRREARVETGWTWEAYLARPRRATGNQFRRNSAGLRVSTENPGESLRSYGFNAAYTEDDEGSSGNGTRAVENRVLSVDGQLAVTPNFMVDGEVAHSRTDTDVTSNLSSIDDWALKLDGTYQLADTGSFRDGIMKFYYEEVRPDFRSISGGGSADQRRFRGEISGVQHVGGSGPAIDLRYFGEHSRDDLDNQLPRETESMTHQFRAGVTPYERSDLGDGEWDQFRKHLRLTTRIRFHDVETSDTRIDRERFQQDYRLESRVNKHRLSGFFQHHANEDQTSGGIDRRRRHYGLDWRYRDFRQLFLGNDLIPADLRLDVTRTEDWQKNGSGASDQTEWNTGSTLYLSGAYRLTVDWRKRDTDHNGGNNDVVRTSWDMGLVGHRLYEGRGRLNFSYRINDVDEENGSNSYREETLRADLEFEF